MAPRRSVPLAAVFVTILILIGLLVFLLVYGDLRHQLWVQGMAGVVISLFLAVILFSIVDSAAHVKNAALWGGIAGMSGAALFYMLVLPRIKPLLFPTHGISGNVFYKDAPKEPLTAVPGVVAVVPTTEQSSPPSDNSVPPEVIGVTGNPVPSGTLTITVKNLPTLLTLADGDVSRIILHVDGYPLKGMNVRRSSAGDDLRYDLKRTSESDSAWAALLGRPKLRPRKVSISVGLENQPIPTRVSGETAQDLNVLGGTGRFVVLVILFLLGLCVSLLLAKRSTLLRKAAEESMPAKMKRFSLARSQMAFWFFAVSFSYLFLWMFSGDSPQITLSVLAALLISGSTCLGAAFIDSRERRLIDEIRSEKISLKEQMESLEERLRFLAILPDTDDRREREIDRLFQLKAQHRRLTTYLPDREITSHGFISDILSDSEGLSFSRFQLVIWTLILLVVFLSSMYNVFAIPNLDVTLLLLMCIGSVTYLGFKLIHISELGDADMAQFISHKTRRVDTST
jgi:hypothetical protein